LTSTGAWTGVLLFNDSVEGTGTIDKIMSSVIVFTAACHLNLAWPTVPPPQYEEKLHGVCSVGMSHFIVHHLEYFLTNSSQRHDDRLDYNPDNQAWIFTGLFFSQVKMPLKFKICCTSTGRALALGDQCVSPCCTRVDGAPVSPRK
jgi:hypothetical protein